jgi:hypothetical protein
MGQSREFVSAIAVRVGIVAGAILGVFVGHWVGAISTPAEEGMRAVPMVAGAIGGFVAAWVGLTWIARRNLGAGAVAGGFLIVAAAVALLVRFAWPRGG